MKVFEIQLVLYSAPLDCKPRPASPNNRHSRFTGVILWEYVHLYIIRVFLLREKECVSGAGFKVFNILTHALIPSDSVLKCLQFGAYMSASGSTF